MWMLFAFLVAVGGLVEAVSYQVTHYAASIDSARSKDYAASIGVIAQAADTFRRTNPSYSGNVPATSLPVPSWYQTGTGSGVVMQGGLAYVYVTAPNTERAGSLAAELTRRGFVAGLASGGTLQAPGGAVVTSAPTSLPAGSVVIVQ